MSNSNASQWGNLTPDTPLPPQPVLTPDDREALRAHTRTDEERLAELDLDTDPP